MSRAIPWLASARLRPGAAATPLTAPSPLARQMTSAPAPTAPLCVRIAVVAPPATPTGPSAPRIMGTASCVGPPAGRRGGGADGGPDGVGMGGEADPDPEGPSRCEFRGCERCLLNHGFPTNAARMPSPSARDYWGRLRETGLVVPVRQTSVPIYRQSTPYSLRRR